MVELRTDQLGGIIKHEPLTAQVSANLTGEGADACWWWRCLPASCASVVLTIVARLSLEQGVFRAQITDWRAVVGASLIDAQYDSPGLQCALADVPGTKDLVNGRYELPAPLAGSTVAVKIDNMLGEELLPHRCFAGRTDSIIQAHHTIFGTAKVKRIPTAMLNGRSPPAPCWK